MKIAFDVDGTLIVRTADGDVPRYEIIAMLKTLYDLGHFIYVHSGGGVDYAQHWVRKLGLTNHVSCISEKKANTYDYDIAFDDEVVELATVNVRV